MWDLWIQLHNNLKYSCIHQMHQQKYMVLHSSSGMYSMLAWQSVWSMQRVQVCTNGRACCKQSVQSVCKQRWGEHVATNRESMQKQRVCVQRECMCKERVCAQTESGSILQIKCVQTESADPMSNNDFVLHIWKYLIRSYLNLNSYEHVWQRRHPLLHFQ